MIVHFSFKQVRLLIHRYLLLTLWVITIGLGGCSAAATSPDARSAAVAPGSEAAADATAEMVAQNRHSVDGAGGCYLGTKFSSPMPCRLAVPMAVVLSPVILLALLVTLWSPEASAGH